MQKILISAENFSKTNNGIFEGWGTSLCWWANRIGFSKKLTGDCAELFFSEKGLNLNIMRYNIGGGDDPSHNHIERTDSEMPGWWKYSEKNKKLEFNSDTDQNQLNILKECYKSAGTDAYVEAFSNSPPYYMTVSGCTSGSHNAVSNNLKKDCIVPFADYLAKVCSYINNELSIEIKSLAAMNEPFTNFWKAYSGKQEGCHISPGKMQSDLIIAVSNALKKYNLNEIIITASDETKAMLQYIATKMMSDKALNEVSRISTHTYGKATPHIGILARKKNKNLWMSESDWSGISGKDSGEMGPALWLAEKIIEDINTLSPSAWVIWQIVAAYISQYPDAKGRFDMKSLPDLTNGFWGTAFADIDKEEIILTKKYFAFGQFTRFIRPGMSVIHTDDNRFIAAYDNKCKRLIIVSVNAEDKIADIIFETVGFDIHNKKITAVRTSGNMSDGENWNIIYSGSLNDTEFSAKLKEHSITTFIIE